MAASSASHADLGPALPPAYRLVTLGEGGCAFAEAVRRAPEDGAGTLVAAGHLGVLDFAVVLEPEECLRGARRAVYAGMAALADALSAVAPPEKPLTIDWPATIHCDGGRLGGGRLAWPAECREDEVPAWLVFGGMVLAAKTDGSDPGRHASATWLVEEGFDPAEIETVVAGFARHLLLVFDRWAEFGFSAVADSYLAWVPKRQGDGRRAIDSAGDLLVDRAGALTRHRLLGPLAAAAWYDPTTRRPEI